MFERFTRPARAAVVRAEEEARRQGSSDIGAEHLLLGVLADTGSAPALVLARHGVEARHVAAAARAADDLDDEALSALGIDLGEVRRRAEETFGLGALDAPGGDRSPGGRPVRRSHLRLSPEARGALTQAVRAAVLYSDGEIGPVQLFLGLLTVPGVVRTLDRAGCTRSTEELIRLTRAELARAA